MMMGLGFLAMLLLWGALLAILVGGVALVFGKTTGARSLSTEPQPTARQLLDERLARGEINQEEYEEIRVRLDP
jgi:putative membrane protein